MGSQYTLVIARALRELGVRSAVLSPSRSRDWLEQNSPKGIILSGGPSSVYDDDAPGVSSMIWATEVPMLGICYGMQRMVYDTDGVVSHQPELSGYGPVTVTLDTQNALFAGIEPKQRVWASHGDTVQELPEGFVSIGTSSDGACAAVCFERSRLWGIQFHAEVADTPCGKHILSNFVFNICGCEKDWVPSDIIEEIRARAREEIGDAHAIIGFSGGVDSTTLAAILSPVLGDHLHALCIDGGHLREGEPEEIRSHANAAGASLTIVGAAENFQEALGGITDAEEKRAAFRDVYLATFHKFGKCRGAKFVVQGSLATDFIESGATGGDTIKTHHNVGLDWEGMQETHPFKDLFKYEVRALADTLELPRSVVERQPFPGPGLFIRVLGEPTTEHLEVVRWADAEVSKILKSHRCRKKGVTGSWYDYVSQLVVALQCAPTVGVKGDKRVYRHSVYVRAVKTIDFMTAEGVQFPPRIRKEISRRVTQHPDVVHVMFAETDKPPATTEFE